MLSGLNCATGAGDGEASKGGKEGKETGSKEGARIKGKDEEDKGGRQGSEAVQRCEPQESQRRKAAARDRTAEEARAPKGRSESVRAQTERAEDADDGGGPSPGQDAAAACQTTTDFTAEHSAAAP